MSITTAYTINKYQDKLIPKPGGWEVHPNEDYGIGNDGMRYYGLGGDVYRTLNGYTSWVCTKACWSNPKTQSYFMGKEA